MPPHLDDAAGEPAGLLQKGVRLGGSTGGKGSIGKKGAGPAGRGSGPTSKGKAALSGREEGEPCGKAERILSFGEQQGQAVQVKESDAEEGARQDDPIDLSYGPRGVRAMSSAVHGGCLPPRWVGHRGGAGGPPRG